MSGRPDPDERQPTADVRALSPLIDAAGLRMLDRIRQHPDAPRWTYAAGDRLAAPDLEAVHRFRAELAAGRGAGAPGVVPAAVLAWVDELRPRVPAFRQRIPTSGSLAEQFGTIATSSREDIATRPELLVPDDADLGRMIVYRTAGTTGHALLVPHDPRAAASYCPLLEIALARHGVTLALAADRVGCFNVGAQAHTVTYATVLSAWQGAGFAKLNLRAGDWPETASPARFFEDLAPQLLTGDPISFAELTRRDIPVRPAAMVTTAVAMSDAWRRRLRERFGCPVIDLYSLTETGPIGHGCPRGDGYHVLPHDLHVEAVDARGAPVEEGARGEITVTGGRNPFLPLLRYRTGDWGRLAHDPCPCGDPAPRILDLEGRAPVLLRSAAGEVVNPVDLSRVLRRFPLVQHQLTQRRDLAVELVVRTAPGERTPLDPEAVEHEIRGLLGDVRIDVRFDDTLGDRDGSKVFPYRSDLRLED
jgi:phenylacetate-CoA ligase